MGNKLIVYFPPAEQTTYMQIAAYASGTANLISGEGSLTLIGSAREIASACYIVTCSIIAAGLELNISVFITEK